MQPESSWWPRDLTDLAAKPPEPPTIAGIAYPGRRHLFSGEPESLKTWAALLLAVEEIQVGRIVAWVDFEMGAAALLERLTQLGLSEDDLQWFRYIAPDAAIGVDGNAAAVTDYIDGDDSPSLVVFDSYTPALALHGLNPDVGVDIEKFTRAVVDPFRRHGAAVVILDHLAKSRDTRGKYSIGSERKTGNVDVHLGFNVVRPFGRGRQALAHVVVHKDRLGHLPRPRAADLELASDPDTGVVTWQFQPSQEDAPTVDGFRPTVLMERVSRYLELQTEPVSRTTIARDVQGKREYLFKAIDCLEREEYVVQDGNARLGSSRPFREDQFPGSSQGDSGNAVPAVPAVPPRFPGGSPAGGKPTVPTVPPLYLEGNREPVAEGAQS